MPYNERSKEACTARASNHGILQLYNRDNAFVLNITEHFFEVNSEEGFFYPNNTASTVHYNQTKDHSKQTKDHSRQTKDYSRQLHVFRDLSNWNFLKVNNTCTNISNANSLRSLALVKLAKKRGNIEPFLHRRLTTTAVNAGRNDAKPTLGMSFKKDRTIEGLTHVNREGKANMVDVSDKADTFRYSVARATVKLGERAFRLVKENKMKKGDVLSVAKLAGIMAAKQTSTLIPLCHNIPLSSVKVDVELDEATYSLLIEGTVKCFGKTGVEMEALTCVSLSALAVYDMCKAVSKEIVITDLQLMEKDGGKSGYFLHNPGNE